jgi:uncharacterized protein (TIGR02646 family)
MKRVRKSEHPPDRLREYLKENPQGTWEGMRRWTKPDDRGAEPYGRRAAKDCRERAVEDQGGLCAYCESKIDVKGPQPCRVEHFHPKSDVAGDNNWGLDWLNMLAVCDGGQRSRKDELSPKPSPANLSCDAHKNRVVQKADIAGQFEGQVLNPLELPSFPNLFAFDQVTGCLSANVEACTGLTWPHNNFSTTEELVENTIRVLNLNCKRLAARRRLIVDDIDYIKDKMISHDVPLEEIPAQLVRNYFGDRWPEFFTTLRCCLGPVVEDHLRDIDYQG